MMHKRSWRWTAWILGAALGTSQVAKAGPIEETAALVLHPQDSQQMLLRYQYGGGGIVYTADGGQSWKLMCGTMVGPGERLEGSIVLTGDSRTLVGVFKGLWQGQNGCKWAQPPELAGVRVTDVVNHPTDPDIAFAVTGTGTEGAQNGMLRRDATGAWTEFGTKDAGILSRMRVVSLPDSALRYYQSGQRGMRASAMGMQVPNYFVRTSNDGGETWTETPFEVDDGTVRLEAVDPSNPDRIVVSIDRTNPPDSLMVSSDQGKTFNEYLSLTDLGGLALAPDGRIWIGDFGNPSALDAPKGLWAAPNLDTAATSLNDEFHVQCVSYQPASDTLFACKRWELGSVDQQTGAFSSMFAFNTANEFVSCDGVDAPSMCKTQLCNDYCGPLHFASAPLCRAYNEPTCGPAADSDPVGTPPAAGTGSTSGSTAGSTSLPLAGSGAMSPAATPESKGSGCAISVAGQLSGAAGQLVLLGLCAAMLNRRRRLSRRPLAR